MDPILNQPFIAGQTPITARWLNALTREVRRGISIEGFDLHSGPEGHAFRRRRGKDATVWIQITELGTGGYEGLGPHTVSAWTMGYTDATGSVRTADQTDRVAIAPAHAYRQLRTGVPYPALDMGDHYEILADDSYAGPWAGRITGDQTITIGGGHGAGYTAAPLDNVRFGRYRQTFSDGIEVSVSASGYVYLDVRLVDLAPSRYPYVEVSAGWQATYPETAFRLPAGGVTYEQSGLDMVEDVTHRYTVVIGYARVLDDVLVSWQQLHYGALEYSLGRQAVFYDESVLQQVWYLRRDGSGALGQYGASVPVSTAAPLYFDPVGEELFVGGGTVYEQVGRIHTNSDGELLALYQTYD